MFRFHLLILFLSYNYYLLIITSFENLPSIVFTTLSVPLAGDRNLPYRYRRSFFYLSVSPARRAPLSPQAHLNGLYTPFGSPSSGGQKPSGTRGCNRPLCCFSKIIPSFFTIKEGVFSTSPSLLQGELHFLPKPSQ